MNTKLIEFLCLSIMEETKAICEYNYRAEHSEDENASELFRHLAQKEAHDLKELINHLWKVSPEIQRALEN